MCPHVVFAQGMAAEVAEGAFCITAYGGTAKETGSYKSGRELSVDEVCYCSTMDPVIGTQDI